MFIFRALYEDEQYDKIMSWFSTTNGSFIDIRYDYSVGHPQIHTLIYLQEEYIAILFKLMFSNEIIGYLEK